MDIIAKCRQIYKAKFEKAFANEVFWGVMKNKPKWLNLKSVDDFTVCPNETKLLSQPTLNLLMRIL